MKTGFLPLTSERGAKAMGARAKPVVNMVMPTSVATLPMFQYADSCSLAGLYPLAACEAKPEAI